MIGDTWTHRASLLCLGSMIKRNLGSKTKYNVRKYVRRLRVFGENNAIPDYVEV